MSDVEKAFGEYLRGLRDKVGLTLRQVEEKARVSNAFLSQIERGERGIPSFKVLSRLANAYGVSVSNLVKVAEDAAQGKKAMPESDLNVVARGLEKLSDAERKEFIGWLQYKIRQKGASAEGQGNEKAS